MSIKQFLLQTTAVLCMSGVVLVSNAPLVQAYEAHVMNVTANIIDNSVSISPSGGKFCNDGKLKIEISTKLSGAKIYYTTNGSEPKCDGSSTLYSEPFTLLVSKTVKAVSCSNGKTSQVASQDFDVSSEYCDVSLKINKVYYNPDQAHQAGSCNNENEWVEIYNPTKQAVNLKGWKICDAEACDALASKDLSLGAKGFAVVTYSSSTWGFWNVPDSALKITLGNAIGNGLSNTADMVLLKDASGQVVDQMNWGTPSKTWPNYNAKAWNPALSTIAAGKVYGRSANGYDTDRLCDWKALDLPAVKVEYPNGGESWTVGKEYNIKWSATNPNGACADLSMDLYYSNDSGKTWAPIAKNTANDGSYTWRVPLDLKYPGGNTCLTPSHQARIKVVATDYSRNFMLSNWDMSDHDFCPPVDKSLLTPEELALLATLDTSGMTFVNASQADTSASADSSATQQEKKDQLPTASKSSTVMNKEDDEYQVVGEKDKSTEKDSDADKDAAVQTEVSVATAAKQAPASQEKSAANAASTTSATKQSETASAASAASEKKSETSVDKGQTAATKTASAQAIAADGNTTLEFNLNS